jgi:uncharacterized RmlC-like cupin family protein
MGSPKVVKPGLPDATAQTAGFIRLPAIDRATTDATHIYMGFSISPPNARSARHNHGEAETAVYIMRGRLRLWYGDDFTEYVEAGPGDYLFVPSHFNHVEETLGDEPVETVFARSPDNIVVNLDPSAEGST